MVFVSFTGPHLPFTIDWGQMNMVDGGQSAIFLGYSSTNGSMIFKLFCDSNDAGQSAKLVLCFAMFFATRTQ